MWKNSLPVSLIEWSCISSIYVKTPPPTTTEMTIPDGKHELMYFTNVIYSTSASGTHMSICIKAYSLQSNVIYARVRRQRRLPSLRVIYDTCYYSALSHRHVSWPLTLVWQMGWSVWRWMSMVHYWLTLFETWWMRPRCEMSWKMYSLHWSWTKWSLAMARHHSVPHSSWPM